MVRSRKTAKDQGIRFQTWVARYLSRALNSGFIESRAKTGAKDTGDIAGVRTVRGERVVIEVKNVASTDLAGWVREAEVERVNDRAKVGLVVHKRIGKGWKQIGESYVTMTLDNLVLLLGGVPHTPQAEEMGEADAINR